MFNTCQPKACCSTRLACRHPSKSSQVQFRKCIGYVLAAIAPGRTLLQSFSLKLHCRAGWNSTHPQVPRHGTYTQVLRRHEHNFNEKSATHPELCESWDRSSSFRRCTTYLNVEKTLVASYIHLQPARRHYRTQDASKGPRHCRSNRKSDGQLVTLVPMQIRLAGCGNICWRLLGKMHRVGAGGQGGGYGAM